MKRVEPFNYEIDLEGRDHFGRWTAEGNFLMTSNGPFLWFIKVYANRHRAGQTGEWWNLLYESDFIGP